MDGAIIIDGTKTVIPGVEVHTWHDHGMIFDTTNSAMPRVTPPTLCVLHWTASERVGEEGARRLYDGMLAREPTPLSVEFMITNEGIVWQFADPALVRCRHASRVNPFSVGVEVSCRGWVQRGQAVTGATKDRDRYWNTIHDWRHQVFDFFPAQHHAVAGLADALVEGLGIRRHVFLEPYQRRGNRDLMVGGFCGHYHAAHWSRKNPKCDPGTRPLEKLDAYFASQG